MLKQRRVIKRDSILATVSVTLVYGILDIQSLSSTGSNLSRMCG